MINTDMPAAWTVYTVEADGDTWIEVATTWSPYSGPIASSRKVVGRFATQELAQRARDNDQNGYDRVRRAALGL